MKYYYYTLLLFALFACSQSDPKGTCTEENYSQYVDPFIGTGEHGHTFPGAVLPSGMVQLSPDTHLDGWDASSGYHADDRKIYAFSHTHLSGTGIGDLGDVAFLPYSNTKEEYPVATFSKDTETAVPGYYRVHLDNFDVDVELTSTLRTGFHRYTFNDPKQRKVVLNLSHILQANWGHKMMQNSINIIDNKTIEGIQYTQGWANDQLVAFRAEFSEPFEIVKTLANEKETNERTFETTTGAIHFRFAENTKPLLLKVALSAVDPEGANKNMKAELSHWDFDKTKQQAQQIWEDELKQIQIETNDVTVKTNFYTSLYHSMLAPFVWQDVDGRYRTMDKKVKLAEKGVTNYTVYSLWDTFRALHPLITVVRPERAGEWANALVKKQREGGLLPKWELMSNYTGTMVGYPAVSVVADAACKGLIAGDINEWKEAAVTSSTWQPSFLESEHGGRDPRRVMSKHIYFKEKNEWVPSDSITSSVAYGVEMAYYDWCVAQIASIAGDKATAKEFERKGTYFKHYFDPETKLMRGRNYDGSWRTPFNPRLSDHNHSDYVEGNAWQWSFFAPHANNELCELHGGPVGFEAMLDTLFTTSSEIEGEHASADISGLIGQYAHGNEPSHHMAYLYNWTNNPNKAQKWLDQIMKEFYTTKADGIIGNEDCGQMSAWYVLSSIGLYQVCPGDPTFTTGRPMVDRAVLPVTGGTFEIVAHNNSAENMYVEKLVLNGKKLSAPFIQYVDIMNGGKLEFYMTSKATSL